MSADAFVGDDGDDPALVGEGRGMTGVGTDLREFADRLLAGTGLTVEEAIAAASGAAAAAAPAASVEALRDGWRSAEREERATS